MPQGLVVRFGLGLDALCKIKSNQIKSTTPDVIIAGDPTAWQPRDVDADLWTRLRAIYLKVWAAHCDVHHGGPTPSPTSIAAASNPLCLGGRVVRELMKAMEK